MVIICMKIGLGLKFSPTTVVQIKLKFCKDNSKVKHSFFFLIMGLSLEGGYRLNKYFLGGSMVPQNQWNYLLPYFSLNSFHSFPFRCTELFRFFFNLHVCTVNFSLWTKWKYKSKVKMFLIGYRVIHQSKCTTQIIFTFRITSVSERTQLFLTRYNRVQSLYW